MSSLRLLYLDVPFEHETGGDKNRSRFLWHALREHCEVDLVLMGREPANARAAWTRYRPLALLPPQTPPFPRSASIPAFARESHDQFVRLLRDRNHAGVFARFCTGWELCHHAVRECPRTAIVMDVDMLSSRLVARSWAAQRSLRRRWFLFETWRLQRFERQLFREPWLFLFTNPTELAAVRDRLAPRNAPDRFALLPNTMPQAEHVRDAQRQPVILFFGSMDSAANIDGFAFLLDEVLPLLDQDLKQAGVEIHVVGKNPPAHFGQRLAGGGVERIRIRGGVDSIERAIAESLFVLLPLRIASGTRTRILEAAAQARAVVTTPLGAEGLELGDAVLLGQTAPDLAAQVRRLLAQPDEATALGQRLRQRALSRYAADQVAGDLVRAVESFVGRRQEGSR